MSEQFNVLSFAMQDRLALRTVVAVAYAAVFLIGSAGAQTDPTIVLSVNNTNFRDGDVVQVSVAVPSWA